jgi:hypothetical protein
MLRDLAGFAILAVIFAAVLIVYSQAEYFARLLLGY